MNKIFQENIFSKITKLANQHQALNVGQGFPTFDPDQELLEMIIKNIKQDSHQYTDMRGNIELRQYIVESFERRFQKKYDLETEITITNGAAQALSCAIQVAVNIGDEVIIINPSYDAYAPLVTTNGGIPISVDMELNSNGYWSINWLEVKRKINNKTKVIILNTPHNPTGSILNENDIRELENLIVTHGLIAISDEVYEYIVFDEYKHISLASSPIIANNSYIISSFGKTLNATGWKIGYCCAPKNLMEKFWSIHQYQVYSINSIPQKAIAEYLQNRPNIGDELKKQYTETKNYVEQRLTETKFKPLPCQASFFILLDYSEISDLPDVEFVMKYIQEKKVAFIPYSAFDINNSKNRRFVRMCFARKKENLRDVINNIII